MDSLISVIVPVYNVEAYLPRCLDSILAQTYTRLEIILVDDGASDASGAICDSYAAQDDRITVIHQENAGIGNSRNVGLSWCTGDYIAFVDSDDFLPTDAFQLLYDRLQADGSDLVIGNCVKAYEDGTSGDPCYAFTAPTVDKAGLLSRLAEFGAVPVAPWGKLYRKRILEGVIYPDVRIGEDMLAFPSILDRCCRISLENTPVYYYFQRATSLMKERGDPAKKEGLYAILHTARYLWENGQPAGCVDWYSLAAKNALHLRKRRNRLSGFHCFFDRKTRRILYKRMDCSGKLAWFSLHLPLIYYVFRTISKKA